MTVGCRVWLTSLPLCPFPSSLAPFDTFFNDFFFSFVKHLSEEKHVYRMCFSIGVEQESRPLGGTTFMNQEAIPGRHCGSAGPSSGRLGSREAWQPVKGVSSLLPLSCTVCGLPSQICWNHAAYRLQAGHAHLADWVFLDFLLSRTGIVFRPWKEMYAASL